MYLEECEKTKRWFLFFPIIHESCKKDSNRNVNIRGKIFFKCYFYKYTRVCKEQKNLHKVITLVILPSLQTLFSKIGSSSSDQVKRVDVEGGSIQHNAALKTMQLDDQNKNWEMYSNWADSIRHFPQVIKQKVNASLNELLDI